MKKWYQSRLILLGGAFVIEAGLEAFLNGMDARMIATACVGALVIYLRKVTTTSIG